MNEPKDDRAVFEAACDKEIAAMAANPELQELTDKWFLESAKHNYSYHFKWMGLPIIQYPQDIQAMQELIWEVKPDLIIETGVARGGSLVFYASMLELLGAGRVVGIDIDIRPHNRKAIEEHPMSKRIHLIEGSSVDQETVDMVSEIALNHKTIMVALDSNHTHDHVLKELQAYAPMVTKGSYCVVFDTVVEKMPASYFADRPWDVGDNPMTAVKEYLTQTSDFQIDKMMDAKLQPSVAPSGYLRRIS